jgi:hypothetical protein
VKLLTNAEGLVSQSAMEWTPVERHLVFGRLAPGNSFGRRACFVKRLHNFAVAFD